MARSFRTSRADFEEVLVLGPISFKKGPGSGVNTPNQFSAISLNQSIAQQGEIDLIAITAVAGQRYIFDIDNGENSGSPSRDIDLEVDVIDARGNLLTATSGGSNDDPNRDDVGSDSTNPDRDPLFTFTAPDTSIYYIAIHQFPNDYGVVEQFSWSNVGGDTGDYNLIISTPVLSPLQTLTNAGETRTFNNADQMVAARGGSDTLKLGGGDDIALGQSGNDTLRGLSGDDQLFGASGNDSLSGDIGNDAVSGGLGDDTLRGGAGKDTLKAGGGADFLSGGKNDDTLLGDSGNDLIDGGEGNDFLRGGTGGEQMRGGAGDDTFHFLRDDTPLGTPKDLIQDFSGRGTGLDSDVIDMTDVFPGNLNFRSLLAFTGAPGEVRITFVNGGFNVVEVNLDGDFAPEMIVEVFSVANSPLNANDFLGVA